MTVRRLAAVDAQMYWMSAKMPNDQFLLYGFAGQPSDLDAAIDVIGERARQCPELTLRVEDRSFVTYPAWVTGDVDARHDLQSAGERAFHAERDFVALDAFAVDSIAHADAILHRLDVNVARPVADGLGDHRP